ncbi:hypothetical protein GCM10011571_27740 [Marinithermofilum abyssi]|uniref:Oxidoreductase molybdopterin-binding domain-containing protein n=1 Tax=Marinithermofilum abyssi TaxID=1571185 RepID=A0A8J2VFX5_9BACL|nr:molybdopterin-dependent oxidoreductase [Marinithermofilum abyssi]GGE24075.1 hypothetical protein GCM10011571_27740 [Marinithermofilum abyssi]
MVKPWEIRVDGAVKTPLTFTYERMQSLDEGLDPAERVPELRGNAVSLKALLTQAGMLQGATHVVFHAADDFQADIPLTDLEQAFILYARDGQPLSKAYPARLYVPDGSSHCLNVKSVIRIEVVNRPGEERNKKASYGFKNVVPTDEIVRWK